jgi:hypothetical protein
MDSQTKHELWILAAGVIALTITFAAFAELQ